MSARGLLFRHESVLALLLVLTLAVLAQQSDKFFTMANMLNQGRLMAEVGIIALAMTFVIVTAGIDLSVGSILGLVAIVMGVLWQKAGLPLPVAIGLGVVLGCIAGFANGFIITKFGVPPL
ncbi:MAG: ABC transporter permease, partial [Deltaproteobacteria bacterium]